MNQGPLACLAETITLNPKGFVKIDNVKTQLYTTFFQSPISMLHKKMGENCQPNTYNIAQQDQNIDKERITLGEI